MRFALRLAAVLSILAAAPAAHAQQEPVRVRVGEPLLLAIPSDHAPSQRPVPALTPDQVERLRRAQSFRDGRLLDRAKDLLSDLNSEVPHHPLIVTEIARVHLARQDFSAVERLGRLERSFLHDSLLLSRELSIAYEKMKRPRDAAEVVLQAWMAVPAEAPWATSAILHLASIDPKSVREIMERFANRSPQRFDLLQGLAQLQWEMGDARTAMKILSTADRATKDATQRLTFVDEMLDHQIARDSTGALEALLDVAADSGLEAGVRLQAANRVWQLHRLRQTEDAGALALARALKDLPASRWPSEMLGGVVRGLRQSGQTSEARALLRGRGPEGQLPPELLLEHALADLRDGPPDKALAALVRTAESTPDGAWFYAEALFYAGLHDSALTLYKKIADLPQGAYAGAALERIYLIEDAEPKQALEVFGRAAYEMWRGDNKRAETLADSLYRTLPPGALWAMAALELAECREASGNAKGALEPLLAIADKLPEDRLAPRARQLAGDIYWTRLKDEAKAAEQYEECLARYPRAWNAPEIRRKLDLLRKERRF
jgi:tetratricopeptide (TPR) repeat protein